jgi:hypothetical protein
MISKPREWIYVEYSFPWDPEIHEKMLCKSRIYKECHWSWLLEIHKERNGNKVPS